MYRCHPKGCLMHFRAAFLRRTWAFVHRWTNWCAQAAAATRPIFVTLADQSAATGSGSSAHSIVRRQFRPDEVMANQILVVCLFIFDGVNGEVEVKKKRVIKTIWEMWKPFFKEQIKESNAEIMSKCREMVIRQLLQVSELRRSNWINEGDEQQQQQKN